MAASAAWRDNAEGPSDSEWSPESSPAPPPKKQRKPPHNSTGAAGTVPGPQQPQVPAAASLSQVPAAASLNQHPAIHSTQSAASNSAQIHQIAGALPPDSALPQSAPPTPPAQSAAINDAAEHAAAALSSAAVGQPGTEAAAQPNAADAPLAEATENAAVAAVVVDGSDAEPTTDDELQDKSERLCASSARTEYKGKRFFFMTTPRPSNNHS